MPCNVGEDKEQCNTMWRGWGGFLTPGCDHEFALGSLAAASNRTGSGGWPTRAASEME